MLNQEQLLQLIRDKVDHPATPRELLQRLRIPREQRATVKRLLGQLVAAGSLVETRGNRYGLPDRMNLSSAESPPILAVSASSCLTSRPEDVSGDIYIAGSNLNQAMHGDRVVDADRAGDRARRGGPDRPDPRTRRAAIPSAASTWTTPAGDSSSPSIGA